MKSSENLRLIAKTKKIYRKLCDLSLSLADRRILNSESGKAAAEAKIIDPAPAHKNVNILSLSVEAWNSFAQHASVWLVAATFAAGLLALQTGKTINRRQANRIAKLEGETATANKRAAVLQASIAPRRLSSDNRHSLVSALSSFSGQPTSLWYGAGNKESEVFVREIGSALNASGWQVFAPAALVSLAGSGRPFNSDSELKTGVELAGTRDQQSLNAANALAAELIKMGFDVSLPVKFNEQEGSMVWIAVEARPEGPQGSAKLMSQNR